MPTVVRIHLSPPFFYYLESFLQEDSASGSSSFGRAIAFQAIGGGFEPRLPLETKNVAKGEIPLSDIFVLVNRKRLTKGRKVMPL